MPVVASLKDSLPRLSDSSTTDGEFRIGIWRVASSVVSGPVAVGGEDEPEEHLNVLIRLPTELQGFAQILKIDSLGLPRRQSTL